ncbi:mRNA interferase HigB [Candidatus Methylomirabilis lanthanidiphila]|uniref:mRNA interferase HigB n=1 Tax=Candidatus Methylomirabilis lanthanidiphila TaxID=2211376 RepID=A0A564ZII4_9BACT|nr:type II toxin-antitoxin system HigB family toxin [Candidatus Methylomirabilis lanthanidiphila]VUZ85114.1 mRNA interferase HigB [Candidatus Methylomirabilis lanthanidiphila]
MKLIGRDVIQLFVRRHPDSRSSLKGWIQAAESNSFKHFVDLKKTFGSADQVKPHTVFDISGNKYRLIAVVDYTIQSVSIECVLTHAVYDEGRWRK